MNMKQFKQIADKYHWHLIKNSWFNSVPPNLDTPRPVVRKNTRGIAFKTIIDGVEKKSAIEWPKASEIDIAQAGGPHGEMILTISRKIPADENIGQYKDKIHTMIYKLIPNEVINSQL